MLSLSFSTFKLHLNGSGWDRNINYDLPSLLAVGPTFDLGAFRKGLEVIVPQPLTIRVPLSGYPTPVAKWTFGEKELSTADERVSMVIKPSYTELTVAPSVRPDKGTYNLQLENDVSSISGEIEVNVIGNLGTRTFHQAIFPTSFVLICRLRSTLSQRAPVLPRTLRWLK